MSWKDNRNDRWTSFMIQRELKARLEAYREEMGIKDLNSTIQHLLDEVDFNKDEYRVIEYTQKSHKKICAWEECKKEFMGIYKQKYCCGRHRVADRKRQFAIRESHKEIEDVKRFNPKMDDSWNDIIVKEKEIWDNKPIIDDTFSSNKTNKD